jgi:3-hydroxybutyryl-CoA dehydratase
MMFAVGDKYQETFSVSEEVYQGFVRLFNDRNPLHTDEAFAQGRGFNGKVMHGNILGGFLSYFIGQSLPDKNVIIHSQEIRYKQAVYLNDVLQLQAVVSDIYESVNAVEFKFEFRNAATQVVAKGKMQIGILS